MDANAHKIMVVDDEISLVQLCQLIFEEAGYSVRGATSGRQALRMIHDDMPDFVLLDVMMPGLDGIEVCRRIRENACPQPFIIMYTADDREVTRNNSLAAGANYVLTKQTPVFDLPARVNAIVKHRHESWNGSTGGGYATAGPS